MFDGIHALYYVPDETGSLAALPCWEVLVNEQTGKRVNDYKTAQLRGLHLAYKPSMNGGYNFLVKGSLHKWFNAGSDNTGQFTMENVQTAVYSLCTVFEVRPELVELHGLEIGVNIPLPFPALRVLKNAVSYKGKVFTAINKRNVHKGLVCVLNDYEVKLYDKAAQSGLPCGHVLRLEVKVNKMRFLKNYRLTTLAALTEPQQAYAAKGVLQYVQDGIIWTDTSANVNAMTDRQQKQWLYLGNPKSWQHLPKEKAYRQRQKLAALFQQFARFDTSKELNRFFMLTWDSLFCSSLEAGNCTPFHRPGLQSEALKKVTISPLECTVKRLPDHQPNTSITDTSFYSTKNDYINGAKNAQVKILPIRYCDSCGNEITHQRKGSRFCSASYVGQKAARVCRNKDSNRRRDIKRKLRSAIQQGNPIAITFTSNTGTIHTKVFLISEVGNLSRNEVDRIQSITLLHVAQNSQQ